MRILGGVAILIAVLLLVMAMMSALSVGHMQQQVQSFDGFQKWANDVSGQTRINEAKINDTAIVSFSFGFGALLLGGLGVAFIVASFLTKRSPAVPPASPMPPPIR